MTDAERNAVGVTLAGKNQYRVLASIMQNFGHAVDATNTALHSSGSAMEENAAYMESLEARTTNIQALFQQLSQTVVDSSLVKSILDIAAAFLQIANTDMGSIITQFVLLSGVVTGISGMIIKGFGIASITLGQMFPYILAITGALVGVLSTIDLVKQKLQEEAEAKTFDGVNKKIQESEAKISEYNGKIQEANDKLKELNGVPFEERTPEIDAEITKLEALIASYDRLREAEQRKITKDYLTKLRKTEYEEGATITGDYGGGVLSTDILEQEKILEVLGKEYSSYEEAVYAASEALASVNDEFAEYFVKAINNGYSVEKIAEELPLYFIEINKNTHDFNTELRNSANDMESYVSQLNSSTQPSEKLLSNTKELIDAQKEYYEVLKSVQAAGGQLNQQELDFISSYDKLTVAYQKATIGAQAYEEAVAKIGTMVSEGETASLEEYVRALTQIEGIDPSNVAALLETLKQTGHISLDYTEEELQNILDKIFGIDESSADVDVDVEDAEAIFDEILSAEKELEANGITIKSTSDANALLESLELIEKKISAMSGISLTINVEGNVSEALSNFNSISSVIDLLPDSKNISVLVETSGTSELSNISSLLSGLRDKTVNVRVNVSQNGSIPFKANGDDNFSGGPVLINDGEPINGSSAELVVANNKAHIYNNGEPTVVNLPKGSKIFNAKDTQNILNGNKDLEFPAFQNGNASYENDGYKDLFDKWLDGKKYLLALNLITEKKYYKDLEDMNEKYLSNIEEAQADYWKHQDEIYKWKTSQIDSQNDALKEQLELEKSLKGVIGAHSNKVLVYKNGTFQYISDIDAIDSAKRSFYKLNDGAKEKSQYSINLGGSGAKVADNTILKNDYQEIKKILQDVKYDDLKAIEWGKKESVKQENYTFSIDNLSLPNAKDVAGILSGLKNYAYQYSYG